MGARGRHGRPPHPSDAATGASEGRLEGDVRHLLRRAADAATHNAGLAGLLRGLDLRARHRSRIHDDCGPSHGSPDGRGEGLFRAHEPPDPVWRRSDEPCLLRHDEPGRGGGDDQGRPRWDQPSDHPDLRRSDGRARLHYGSGFRGQPGHASPALGHRSGGTWSGPLCARQPPAP